MKSRIYWSLSVGLALAVLAFSGGQPQEAPSLSTNNTAPPLPDPTPDLALQATNAPVSASMEQPAEDDVVDAEVQPISNAKPLPPNVKLSGPAAEVARLANSGLDESVMLAFVTNSTSTFNLSAEDIIYLNDIGVLSVVVTAMIERDQALKLLAANAAPAAPPPAAPETSAAQPEPTPAPTDMAPQPAYPTETYVPPADSTYTTFYDSLAPYGTWIDVAGYGPCWQPTVVIVNPGWRPYCHGGRWLYTDCGWYWSSGYSWGWAPFHYGRWFRHRHMGWCWAPGNVWGPSWVCWRYGGNYCGWAPLPPTAGFTAGVGLTFHGSRVHSSFAFGLGVNSFSFVNVSRFSNPHVNRYALPPDQVRQAYQQTVPSTTIASSHTRVVNRGIPVSRVERATHTDIRRIGIREANAPTAHAPRGEQFDARSRTLSVFRPHFSPSAVSQPATGSRQQPGPGGRSRSETRNGSSGAAAMTTPALTTPRLTPSPSARTFGGARTPQPNTTPHVGTRTGRPATGSAPTLALRSSDPPSETVTHPVPRGLDRSDTTAAGSGATAFNQPAPRSSVTIIGRREASPWRAASRPSAPTAQVPRQGAPSRPVVNPTSQSGAARAASAPSQSRSSTLRPFTAPSYSAPAQVPRSTPAPAAAVSRIPSATPRQHPLPGPTVNQRSQPVISSAAASPAPSAAARSAPHPTSPQIRSEPQRQFTAPTYRAPAAVPRVAPAPAAAPQQMRSYSPPAASVTPRAQAMESRPAPAPAASSSSGRAHSSSGRGGR